MKIENVNLSRSFELEDGHFYTSYLVNKGLGKKVDIPSRSEFRLVFCDETTIDSSQCQAQVLDENDKQVAVQFNHEGLIVIVDYQAREDVLEKVVTIVKSEKEINYIDTEYLVFSDQDHLYHPKKQDDIKEMAGFSGYYVELGQPIYGKSFFFGMEFPMGENRLEGCVYYSRYYVGYAIEQAKTIWPAIIGAAVSESKEAIQHSFFDYIEGIAQPSYFRKQYNSWYDHMTDIDEEIILTSFEEISHGFKDHGIHLDAYVVDDGWCDYQSLWDFNEKFPNKLSRVGELVHDLGGSLGLWIGPRGGYNGTEVIMSDWLEEHPEYGSKNKLSNDVNVGDLNYLARMKEKMLAYQEEFDISYWKIDGWLLKPDQPDISGEFAMHTMTPVYEYLIDLLKDLRQARGEKDCWLNLTSYVNPSPWFLQWVNSLWIQISQDVGFTEHAGGDIQRMMTYRDCQYEEFLSKRDIQLPLWSLYNHEPIYASTAHTWYMDHQMYATVEEFEGYLYFIATRGNAFWEFHYSYAMFDKARWEANARAVKWIEANYATLKHSKKIGGSPSAFAIYGYQCIDENKEILSLRNPLDKSATISSDNWDLRSYQIIRGNCKFLSDTEIELSPYEILILTK